jgi:LPS sulfotransferase NodH
VGRFQTDQTELWLRRALAFDSSREAGRVTVLDVAYPDLVADPAAVLRRIWAAADLEPLAEPQAFVDQYNADHPRHGKGVHRYAPEDFGLVPGEIRERFAFIAEGT